MPKILLVEDDEMNRDMLSRRLARLGFDVQVAISGHEGIRKAYAEPADVILMDLSLPELDGWETTRRLKSDQRTSNIPIIALTAHALSTDRERAMAAGCDEFATKPVEFNTLVGMIQALLDRGSPI
jgi:CheY-like chemotaxis protein